MTQFGKPTEVYGYQTLFREIGYYISRLERYESSLKCFDEALNKTPIDKRALIGRSRARAKVSRYEGALQDINNALGLEPNDLVLLADKALNTYYNCQFEEGLVQNSRLVPVRQKPDHFTMGVMECSDAIENCIGERTGRPLRDHFLIIRRLAWKKNYDAQKPFEPKPVNKPKKKKIRELGLVRKATYEPVQPKKIKSKKSKILEEISADLQINDSLHSVESNNDHVPQFLSSFPYKPLQNYTSNIENYMSEKYLDSMYLDKIFLEKLVYEPGVMCPNKDGSRKIRQLAKDGFKTISYKQELLRTRRPFYFIKYQEATVSGALKARQKMELIQQQQTTKMEADVILGRMLEVYEQKDVRLCLEMVNKLKRFCDSKPKKLLQDKCIYMDQIYDKVCKVWYEYYRINHTHHELDQNKRIFFLLGLPLSREPSSDSVVYQFKNVFIDLKKEITEVEKQLQDAYLPEAICWYYYDLSRYHYDMKRYDMSRVYARKCIHEAYTIKNLQWVFNCQMLMIKGNMAEHNKNDAKNDILKAITCVQKLNDTEKVNFLKKCLAVVESFEFDTVFGTQQIEKRETKIIQMMASSKMKDEVAHLFRQMAAMPSSRRMVLIPGVKAEETSSGKFGKGRMSIMPNSAADDQSKFVQKNKQSNTEIPGLQVMELLQLHV